MNHQFWKNVATFYGTYDFHMASPQAEAYNVFQWGFMGKYFYKKEGTFA
jgi:hypothetical protein